MDQAGWMRTGSEMMYKNYEEAVGTGSVRGRVEDSELERCACM